MSAENVQMATRLVAALPLDDLAGAVRDPARVEAMAATLETVVHPDVEVMSIGPAYMGEGAAVMTFRDGIVHRIEFHLDRERAMKAAGVSE